MAEPRLSDDELVRQIEAAREADRAAELAEPRARDARYDPASGRIVVELRQGAAFAFPPDMYPELAGRSAAQLQRVQPSPSGEGLSWPDLDVHVEVAGVLVRMLGNAMLAAFARRGGSATSERKAAAARANGALGGRPRKRQEPVRYSVQPGYGVMRLRETRQEKLTSPELPSPDDPAPEEPPPSEPPRGRRKRSGP